MVCMVVLNRCIRFGNVLWKNFDMCSVMLMCGWLKILIGRILKLVM